MTERTHDYTTGEVARHIGVSDNMVAKWIDQGRLPAYRFPPGNHRRVRHADLMNFLAINGLPPLPPLSDSLQAAAVPVPAGPAPQSKAQLRRAVAGLRAIALVLLGRFETACREMSRDSEGLSSEVAVYQQAIEALARGEGGPE